MDKDILTAKIAAWLDKTVHTADDVPEGALMLLQVNRNRILYNQIMRFPKKYISKLEYELRKHYRIRLDGQTIAGVQALDAELTPQIEVAVKAEETAPEAAAVKPVDDGQRAVSAGKRADHDQLPADIQNLWDKNAKRWKRIKEQFEQCKSLDQPCDRYEHLVILKKLWYDYKADFQRYDTYQPVENQPEDPAETHKLIGNARAYISKNLDNLLALSAQAAADGADEKTIEKCNTLREKIQDRVRTILAYGQTISDDQLDKLRQADIYVS